jgi:hypothetical protein
VIRYYRRQLDPSDLRRRWLDPRLNAVRVADLTAYLERNGWKQVPSDRSGFLVFEEPAVGPDGPLYQFVPETEAWDGFAAWVYEQIGALAEYEDRFAGDVLADILPAHSKDGPNGVAADRPPQTAEC